MLEEQIKNLIIEKYGSVRRFSLKIGVPYTTIDSILKRGIDNSNVSNVIKMCKALDLSIDKTIENNALISNLALSNISPIEIDIENDMLQIPVYGTIKAGIPIEAQSDITEYVDVPRSWVKGGKKFYGLKISGDSMYPKYLENDIVILEQNDDNTIYNGKDCAVMINGSEATFKKVLLNEQGLVLQPYNTAYDIMMFSKEQVETLPIKIVGIAKEKRTRL